MPNDLRSTQGIFAIARIEKETFKTLNIANKHSIFSEK